MPLTFRFESENFPFSKEQKKIEEKMQKIVSEHTENIFSNMKISFFLSIFFKLINHLNSTFHFLVSFKLKPRGQKYSRDFSHEKLSAKSKPYSKILFKNKGSSRYCTGRCAWKNWGPKFQHTAPFSNMTHISNLHNKT